MASALLFIRFRVLHPGIHIRIKPSLHLLKQSMPLAVELFSATVAINYPSMQLGIFTTTSMSYLQCSKQACLFFAMGDRNSRFALFRHQHVRL